MNLGLSLNNLQCVLLGVCILISATFGNANFTQNKDTAADDKITELLRERLALYVEVHKLTLKAYENGEVTLLKVFEAKGKVLTATLDLCVSKTERIAVHEEMVKLAEQRVEAYEKLAKVPEVTRIDVLNARAQLLEEKIALEKAKAAP